ncbi:MAG: Bifunctional protein: zinc-containing alcohol dehydrogenase [Rhodospirillales bacterium]|nr:Bifunctional protein: zinc-containing alcohol dehydrogenase [Rhodospirillales bacterium]
MPIIPNIMRAVALDRFGGPEVLTLHTLPVPIPDPDEVLIAVHTAGIGVWDVDIREGWSPSGSVQFPLVLGSDGSGTVAAVGANVDRFAIGDEVYSFAWDNPKGGFYAEYSAVPSHTVARVPEGLDLEHAGAVPVSGLTALQGIDDHLHLTAGETVIIHGATGGVGTVALQFAKLREASVLATAIGEDGVALVRHLGADQALDGRRNDIAAAARGYAPNGVDAVLAFAGGDALERCVDALREGGRVAFPNGVEPEPKPRRGIVITPYDADAGVAEFERLNRAIEASRLEVVIAAAYPLSNAAKAHERLAAGHVLGKLVLRVR